MGLNPCLKSEKIQGYIIQVDFPTPPFMTGQGKKKSKEKTTKLLYYVHELTLSFKFSCTELEKKMNSHFKC